MTIKNLHTIKNSHNKWVFNTFLWLFFFGILVFIFSDFPPKKIDIIYTFSYLITLFFPVTITLYYLVPKFLKREKYVLFIMLLLATITVFALISNQFHQKIIDVLFPNYFFISYYNNYQTFGVFILFTLTALFIKLTEDWVYFNKNEKLQIKTKLDILKGQINPHFLFNSLNVLYSLSLEKKQETTNAILQLSNILRYVIYDANSDKVPLKKEVDLITNYISFEKNRHLENVKIHFNHTVNNDAKIYPMLLLPIIENAFKHGAKSAVKNPFVTIDLQVNGNSLVFCVQNNFTALPIPKNKGIGLKNVRQNLAIVYPKKHTFTVEKTTDTFNVKLQIQLKK